jgi:sigma-E factor negative regulatory protein RseA
MKDRISALMDGELDDRAAAQAIEGMRSDRQGLETWRMYHLISDAMRDSRVLSEGFVARVAGQIDKEPALLAPHRARVEPRRWIPLSAAASVAAVALVGWVAFGPQQNPENIQAARAPAVAAKSQPAPTVAKAEPPADTAVRPAIAPQFTSATNDYLLAHQGFSSRISLQGMVPYVRTVSESSQEAGK